jgi:hypothetical protein
MFAGAARVGPAYPLQRQPEPVVCEMHSHPGYAGVGVPGGLHHFRGRQRRGSSGGKGFGKTCCQMTLRPTPGSTAGWGRPLGRQRRLKAGRKTVYKWSR